MSISPKDVLDAVDDALPLIHDLFSLWLSQKKDPRLELKALMDAGELAAIQLEKAKFGTKP